jgi:hypothetical protein
MLQDQTRADAGATPGPVATAPVALFIAPGDSVDEQPLAFVTPPAEKIRDGRSAHPLTLSALAPRFKRNGDYAAGTVADVAIHAEPGRHHGTRPLTPRALVLVWESLEYAADPRGEVGTAVLLASDDLDEAGPGAVAAALGLRADALRTEAALVLGLAYGQDDPGAFLRYAARAADHGREAQELDAIAFGLISGEVELPV